jgi:putative ABC transport system ATP-binding protein
MTNELLIKLDDLNKDYTNEEVVTPVLHRIDFSVRAGEFVAIMGPSGSGKSTLMHILGFLDRPSSGKYFFDGEDTTEFDDKKLAMLRNKKVGFIFQSFNLLPKTTVLDNVILPLIYDGVKDKKARAMEAIKAVGLEHRTNFYSNQLSGGEKQRVAIARAIVNNPAVIFADEPTGNLDSKSGQQIMKILQDLNEEGHTIILVTHETFTSEHAKRIIRIKDGQIESDELVKIRRFAKDGELLK